MGFAIAQPILRGLMLGEAGAAATREYAKRTRLPAYTANTRHEVKTLLEDIGVCSAECGKAQRLPPHEPM